jgi:hypothetical protein
VTADSACHRRLLDFARVRVPGRRCWAVEGAAVISNRRFTASFYRETDPQLNLASGL